MSISSNLTKLTTDITNAYTSIENKGGTIPANKNTENMSTAIDSIEVIEQATAEGESLSLTNTKAMPYSDYVVEGKSEQTTRSGKNLLQNTATSQTISGVTFTVNEDGSVTCNGTATNNIFFSLTGNNSIENIIINGCPAGGSGDSYLVRAIDTNGKVLKTDVGEGTEAFNLINARIQIRIAKDYICNNLTFYPMIRLATIEDDTYEPYGASPSPDYPSEIHSVADDVNLFDASKIANSSISVTDNGKTIKLPIASSGNGNVNTSAFLKDLCPKLNVGDVVYLNFTRNINPNTNNFIYLYNRSATPSSVEWSNGTSKTITQDLLDSYMILYGNRAQDGETEQCIITDFKIQKNTIPINYSPYNQGTVTIKQRGKNLFKIENFQKIGWNIAIKNPLKGLNPEKYTISCVNAYKEGIGMAIAFSNQPFDGIVGNYFTGYNFGDGNKYYNTQTITQEQIDAEYMRIMPSDNGVTQEVLENMQIQIEKGSTATSYEPYQANDFTFQTEPLRSLPNGVKDTIEEDGIHRRVGKIVLNGTETWEEAGTQYTGLYSVFIYIDDMKKQEGYNGDLLSNYFKENDFSTQEEGITKSSNPTSFALILIRLSNDNATNMTTFKNWLSNNPTELLYELATEVIEPLTQNQATTMLDIIKTGSYEGTTNIYTDEDVKPTIKVGYYKKK